MIAKVKDENKETFMNSVFGADDFAAAFPEIFTVGVEFKRLHDSFFIIVDGKIAGDSVFFNDDEFELFEIIED